MKRSQALFAGCLLLSSLSCTAFNAVSGVITHPESHLERPSRIDFQESLLGTLKLAPGLAVTAYATGVKGARMLAVTPDGTVLVTRPSEGDVVALFDRDGDGRS